MTGSSSNEIEGTISNEEGNDYDALVIVRGGGSKIEMKCFDSKSLCNKLLNCRLETFIGIGHKNDDVLCNYASNNYGITPTGVGNILARKVGNKFSSLFKYRELISKNKNILDYGDMLLGILESLCKIK